jgi:hypothetical protein
MPKMTAREKRLAAFKARQKKTEKYEGKALFEWLKPGDYSVWDWREAQKHMFDIVPYIAGNYNPHFDKGDEAYVVEIFIHKQVGGGDTSYICPKKTWGKPCPICEHRISELKNGVDWKELQEFNTTKYPTSIYNVIVYDSDEEEKKGIQLFIVPHFNMEFKLKGLVESTPKEIAMGEPPEKLYSDPTEEGYMISFVRNNLEGANYEALSHQLVKRNYSVEDMIDQAYCLDELLVIPTYDELWEALYGEKLNNDPEPDKDTSNQSEAPINETMQSNNECPHGHVFAVNYFETDDCEICELHEDCKEKSNELIEAEEQKINKPEKEERKKPQRTSRRVAPNVRGRG